MSDINRTSLPRDGGPMGTVTSVTISFTQDITYPLMAVINHFFHVSAYAVTTMLNFSSHRTSFTYSPRWTHDPKVASCDFESRQEWWENFLLQS